MIPCRKNCADYCEGCHKNCARWKAFLEQSSQQRREKKRYLDYYNDLCSTIIRQCRSNNPYLSQRYYLFPTRAALPLDHPDILGN